MRNPSFLSVVRSSLTAKYELFCVGFRLLAITVIALSEDRSSALLISNFDLGRLVVFFIPSATDSCVLLFDGKVMMDWLRIVLP